MNITAVGDYMIDYYSNLNLKYLGGNSLNFIMRLQGIKGNILSFVGPVARDEGGIILLEALKAFDVSSQHISLLEGSSPLSIVEVVSGDRTFKGLEIGVLEDFILNKEQISFLRNQDHIHSSIMGGIIGQLGDIKGKGSISFDFSILRNRKIIMEAMKWVDYAFFSSKVFEATEENLMREAHLAGAKNVVFLLGHLGSIAFDGERIYKASGLPGDIVDTLGAGDSYIAGYMSQVWQGASIEEAMEIGSIWALETCGHYGGNQIEEIEGKR